MMNTNTKLTTALLLLILSITITTSTTIAAAADNSEPCSKLIFHDTCLSNTSCMERDGACVDSPGLFDVDCDAMSDNPQKCQGTRFSGNFYPCLFWRGKCRPACSILTPPTGTDEQDYCNQQEHCWWNPQEKENLQMRCLPKCTIANEPAACRIIGSPQHSLMNPHCEWDAASKRCHRSCDFFRSKTACLTDDAAKEFCTWIEEDLRITPSTSTSSSSESDTTSSYSSASGEYGCVLTCERAKTSTQCFALKRCSWINNRKCVTHCPYLQATTKRCTETNPACGILLAETGTGAKVCAVQHCSLLSRQDCELREQARCIFSNGKCYNRCSQFDAFSTNSAENFLGQPKLIESSSGNNNETTAPTCSVKVGSVEMCKVLKNENTGEEFCVMNDCKKLSVLGKETCYATNGVCAPMAGECRDSCTRYDKSQVDCSNLHGNECQWDRSPNSLHFGCKHKCPLIDDERFCNLFTQQYCQWLPSENQCAYRDKTKQSSSDNSNNKTTTEVEIELEPCTSFHLDSKKCAEAGSRCEFINTSTILMGCVPHCSAFKTADACIENRKLDGCVWSPFRCSCVRSCELRGATNPQTCNVGATCSWNTEFEICGHPLDFLDGAPCMAQPQVAKAVLLILVIVVVGGSFYVIRKQLAENGGLAVRAPSGFAALRADDEDPADENNNSNAHGSNRGDGGGDLNDDGDDGDRRPSAAAAAVASSSEAGPFAMPQPKKTATTRSANPPVPEWLEDRGSAANGNNNSAAVATSTLPDNIFAAPPTRGNGNGNSNKDVDMDDFFARK